MGSGAFGAVLEYDYRGLKCVGKKLHSVLCHPTTLKAFEDECELLAKLRHPNIVLFLGVHMAVEESSSLELPVLVMEYVSNGSLSGYLALHGSLPVHTSYSLLRDVVIGLRYLHDHSPEIVHRDLTANNVLLTSSLSAKIADLGVARILSHGPCMSTPAPGTVCYMPPEALVNSPCYTRKLDSFSFGVLILHTLCCEWPTPVEKSGTMSEVQRRARFFRQIDHHSDLSSLACRCLDNNAQLRPEAKAILIDVDTAMRGLGDRKDAVHALMEENGRLRGEIQALWGHYGLGRAHLEWRKCDDTPVAMAAARAIVMGDKVYVGGGDAPTREGDSFQMLKYSLSKRRWTLMPQCKYRYTTMAQFRGKLIAVGGIDELGIPTKDVFSLEEDPQPRWVEFNPCMPTARYRLSVATTDTAIVAAGGKKHKFGGVIDTVEVYSCETGKWHEADPLPIPRRDMSSVVIDHTFHLVGGIVAKTDNHSESTMDRLCASLHELIERATSGQFSRGIKPWKTISNTPLFDCSAICLAGQLVIVGGKLQLRDTMVYSSSVYYCEKDPESDSRWIQLRDDLPTPRSECTIAQCSPMEVIAIGGYSADDPRITNTVYIGKISIKDSK